MSIRWLHPYQCTGTSQAAKRTITGRQAVQRQVP
jgi:hypothetical protein